MNFKPLARWACRLGIFSGFIGLSACSQVGLFESSAFLSSGLRGRSWGEAITLEPRPAIPSTTDPRTFSRFDAGSDGTNLYVLASFYESDSGLFEYEGLRYQSGEGFLSTGEGSFHDASAVNEAGIPWLIEDLLGGRLLAVLGDRISEEQFSTVLLQGGQWETPIAATITDSILPLPSADSTLVSFHRSPVYGSFDGTGRAHLAWGGDPLGLYVRDGSGTNAFDTDEQDQTLTSVASSGERAGDSRILSDGAEWVCAFFRDSSSIGVVTSLFSSCFSGLKSDLQTTELLAGVAEFDAATDLNGNFLVLARDEESSDLYSFVLQSIDGDLVVDAEVSFVFDGLLNGRFSLSSASPDEANGELLPAFRIAAVGAGKFVAVWVAHAASLASSSQTVSRIYSATYDLDTSSWSDPEWVGEWEDSFTHHLALSGLSLKGRLNGNAVLALNWAEEDGATVADDIRKTLVSRFAWEEGWMPIQVLGDGCGRFILSGVTNTRECAQSPAVALSDSGDALVVFSDQDDGGLFRLKASAFEK